MDNIVDITRLPTFYINLDDNKGRKKRVESLLLGKRFQNFERFPATKLDGRSVGCSTSHKLVLEHIVKNDIFPSLILEDDVGFYDFRKKIKIPQDADAMYVGFSRYGWESEPEEKISRGLKISQVGKEYHRVENMLARHAIIHLNKDYSLECIEQMDKFLSDPKKYIAGDIQVASIHRKWNIYSQNVPIFYQNDRRTKSLTNHSIYTCSVTEVKK